MTYISKTTQNTLINCCGEEILSTIVNRVQAAKFYSVIFDETTDIAHISQITLVLRYGHQNVIREDFVKFTDLHKEINILREESTDFWSKNRFFVYRFKLFIMSKFSYNYLM